jgi:hypothetical protein
MPPSGVFMFAASLLVSLVGLGSEARADDGPKHSFAVRFRQGSVPRAIIDQFYFDADELPPELNYVRPDINTRVFGLDYTLHLLKDDVGLQFWGERFGVPMEEGFWDDREDPADHSDGQWFDPTDLGAWSGGANFVYNVPIVTTVQGFELKLSMGAGLGLGAVTGQADVWKNGASSEVTSGCLTDDPAPERRDTCPSDGQVALPGVIPFLDVTIGPRIRLFDKLLVRGDFGFHDSLYWGVAAGVAL